MCFLLLDGDVLHMIDRTGEFGVRHLHVSLQEQSRSIHCRAERWPCRGRGGKSRTDSRHFRSYRNVTGIRKKQCLVMERTAHSPEDQFFLRPRQLLRQPRRVCLFDSPVVLPDSLVEQRPRFIRIIHR
ncbi:MAG: hypothetical protein BWY06_00596 [Candidatus Latescibacteria bacterium ADurb.Bin168]|nr:MAG: hypothetical protein BWY06_00596 [Candidatus Latescibacteria bacterium ADurb.Bin168]